MKRHISEIDHERLTAEIANLTDLGNDELKVRWKAAYGTAAPLRCADAQRANWISNANRFGSPADASA